MAQLNPAAAPGKGVVFGFGFEPPLKQFNFEINRFADGITDFSTLFGVFSEMFQAEMRSVFETEGSASGPHWVPLTPAYEKRKEWAHPGMPIGVASGALREGMTGGGGYSEHITHDMAEFGLSTGAEAAKYGKYFAKRRPVVRMKEAWGREWQKAAHEWLVSEARSTFSGGGGRFATAFIGRIKGTIASAL